MSKANDFLFLESEHFSEILSRYQPSYRSQKPFPHTVIDGFLPLPFAERIADEFPRPDFASFKQPDNAYQVRKLGRVQESNFKGLPGFTRHMLNEFNGKIFLDFLEQLTGIEGLVPDPHFFGGALHQILPGGKLSIHADFNKDLRRHLDRRVNVLIYFNRDWKEEFGGHLELWNKDMSQREHRISPLFNRCVIFNTSSTSFHGHPDPLTCPEDRTRNSIALYYYTNGRPKEAGATTHNTLWKLRPGETAPVSEATAPPWKRLLTKIGSRVGL